MKGKGTEIRKERHNNQLDGIHADSVFHYRWSCSNRVRQDSSSRRLVTPRSIDSSVE